MRACTRRKLCARPVPTTEAPAKKKPAKSGLGEDAPASSQAGAGMSRTQAALSQ